MHILYQKELMMVEVYDKTNLCPVCGAGGCSIWALGCCLLWLLNEFLTITFCVSISVTYVCFIF